MSCSITSGITLGCKDSQGGLEYLYIADLPTYDKLPLMWTEKSFH